MNDIWKLIAEKTNQHGYMSGIDRMSDRVRATGEIFTPTALVIEILQVLPIDSFAPGKTILDPACGDGQFLVPIKWIKVLHFGMSESDAVNDIYGVDIMRDNVDLCIRRLGGGHILMGDALHPNKWLKKQKQTQKEHDEMVELFGNPHLEKFLGRNVQQPEKVPEKILNLPPQSLEKYT